MPLEVTQHQKLQYASSVMMMAQQTRNPMQGAVTTIPATGEAQSVADLLDTVEAVRGDEKSRRNVETPISGSRRWVVLQPSIKAGMYITKEEKFRQPRHSAVWRQPLAQKLLPRFRTLTNQRLLPPPHAVIYAWRATMR